MSPALFAYGTLESPEIVERLLGRRLPAVEAVLDGFAPFRVRGELYPGLVERPGDATPGTLLRGVNRVDRVRLDEFEGRMYETRDVRVAIAEEARPIEAFTYVLRPDYVDSLSDERWDRRRFLDDWLPRVLERYRV